MKSAEVTKSNFLSWSTAGRVGFTFIFFFWIYLIWTSTAVLDAKLDAVTDLNAEVRAIQVEFKNEVQDWKDLLLQSTSQDTLNTSWQTYETQYQKVAAKAQDIIRQSDSPGVKDQIKTFVDAHTANHEQYKKSQDLLVNSNFNPHPADAAAKGIDRPLFSQLEAVAATMEQDTKRVEKGLVDQTRNDIEEKLIALAFLSILAVWLPRY